MFIHNSGEWFKKVTNNFCPAKTEEDQQLTSVIYHLAQDANFWLCSVAV